MDEREEGGGTREAETALGRARDVRERVLDARERLLDARQRSLEVRERLLDAREDAADARDRAADRRDRAAGEGRGHTPPSWADDHRTIAAQQAAEDSYRAAREERIAAASVRAQAAEDRARAAEARSVGSRFRGGVPLDDLTRVLRRGAGTELIDRELDRAKRLGEPLTLAFVDVDQLKDVNDRLGHLAGDDVLKAVAQVLQGHLRTYDIVVRFGGDEFLVAFVNAEIGHARRRLAAVNVMLSEGVDAQGEKVPVTISFGVAERGEADTTDLLIKEADADLLTKRMLARPERGG
jgi:diguanylate cyclase